VAKVLQPAEKTGDTTFQSGHVFLYYYTIGVETFFDCSHCIVELLQGGTKFDLFFLQRGKIRLELCGRSVQC